MEKQKPSKNSILVWRIRATLILFGTAFILGALFVFFPIISSIIAALIIIAYILAITIYCPKLYKHTNFYLVGNNLIIEQGFFVRRKCMLSPEPHSIYYNSERTYSTPLRRLFSIVYDSRFYSNTAKYHPGGRTKNKNRSRPFQKGGA